MSRRFLFALGFVMLGAVGAAYASTEVLSDIVSARAYQTCRGESFNKNKRNAGVFQSGCGYFTNQVMNINTFLTGTNGYILTGGIFKDKAVGATTTNATLSKADYIASIKDRLNNGGTQDKNGAAFIIQTMRGATNGADWNTDRPPAGPTAAQIKDWEDRINNPDITMSIATAGAEYGNWLSTCRPDTRPATRVLPANRCDEIAFIDYTSVKENGSRYGINSEKSVVFYSNSKASVMYVQRTKCANTFGSLSAGLPQGANYDLTPTITVNPTVGEPGTSVTTTSTVSNGGTSAAPGVNWQISTFKLTPTEAIPAAGTSGAATTPQAFYGHNAVSPPNGGSGTGTFQPGITSPNPIASLMQTLGDEEVGTKVCYGLSVRPYSHNTTDWRHSAAVCLVIAKKPRIQIWGGDLIVGKTATSNIVTSKTSKDVGGTNRIFGSWAEYGVLASGTVTNFGSGAGYSGGATSTASCDVQLLTFTNAGTSTCTESTAKGGYAMTTLLPAMSERLTATAPLPSATTNLQNTATGSYSSAAAVTLTNGNANATVAMNIAKKKWIVINAPTQTVTIKNNIVYAGDTIQSMSDIPQVVIIANQITIEAGVTQVDAWLIASGTNGTINTCAQITNPTTQLNASTCNQQLTVNGPVIARKLLLYRTAGSGTGLATGKPAEVFNFRPDAYLWATSYSMSSGRLQTVSTKELPPRF